MLVCTIPQINQVLYSCFTAWNLLARKHEVRISQSIGKDTKWPQGTAKSVPGTGTEMKKVAPSSTFARLSMGQNCSI